MILAKIQAPETLDELSQLWVEATPKNPTALLARADLLMSTNRHTEAQTVYKNILGLTPQNTAALNNLAWLLRESDPTKALALAKRATELAPKTPPYSIPTGGFFIFQEITRKPKNSFSKL